MHFLINSLYTSVNIIPHIVGLQTKGKFACPICGSIMISQCLICLGKKKFDEYKHFLPKNHQYRTIKKYIFNGKEENRKKPQRMTSQHGNWNITIIIMVSNWFPYHM